MCTSVVLQLPQLGRVTPMLSDALQRIHAFILTIPRPHSAVNPPHPPHTPTPAPTHVRD